MSCEVIDLVSILPWDEETIYESVKKPGRCIVTHEAPLTNGFGAELAAAIQVIMYFSKVNKLLQCLKSSPTICNILKHKKLEKNQIELLSEHTYFRVTAS